MRKYFFAMVGLLFMAHPAYGMVYSGTTNAINTQAVTTSASVINTRLVTTSITVPEESRVVSPVETKTINPQPEPPATINSTETGGAVTNPLERVMLNPQPEPPAPANILGDKVEMENQITGASIPNFSQEVKIGGTVEMKNEQTVYSENGKNYEIKSVPAIFYKKLTSNLEKSGIGESSVKSLQLKTEGDKAVYEIQVNEPVKWFGLFKSTIATKVTVAADKEQVQKVERPWYSFLLAVSDLKNNIEILPNLRVSEVKIIPAVYKQGDNVQIEATVINDGPGMAVGGCNLVNGSGYKEAAYVDGGLLQWYCAFVALKPGETDKVTFNWSQVWCNKTVSVKVDTASHINETDETDNEGSTVTQCQ